MQDTGFLAGGSVRIFWIVTTEVKFQTDALRFLIVGAGRLRGAQPNHAPAGLPGSASIPPVYAFRSAGLQPGILTPLLWRAFKDPSAVGAPEVSPARKGWET